ncbi:NADPH-dependent 1-acyl dihydroxyacetone phosphate reductase [Hypoxylon texense]
MPGLRDGPRREQDAIAVSALGIETPALDVTSDESIASALLATVRKATGGSLDYLVSDAGANHVMPLADARIDDLRRVLGTNVVVAVLAVAHAFLPLLVEAHGATATAAGSVSEVFRPPRPVHAASRTLRVELARPPLPGRPVRRAGHGRRAHPAVRQRAGGRGPRGQPVPGRGGRRGEPRVLAERARWVEPEAFAR